MVQMLSDLQKEQGCFICCSKTPRVMLPFLGAPPCFNGLYQMHAYSVLRIELGLGANGDVDLVQLRNPHGVGEWNGAWSDGDAMCAPVPCAPAPSAP